MKTSVALATATLFLSSVSAFAGGDMMVGGAPMSPEKTIVQNASAAHNLTTLVTAVKAADLADTLSGAGPFTVFAPTNMAFKKLPDGTVTTLLEPENKAKLASVLTYHVVPGKLDAKDLMADVNKGGGKAMLKTVQGEELTVTARNGHVMIADASGHMAEVIIADVEQSNGVVHVINRVLLP
jgi:uncharacterized surface protein with fasciclin (FAS1) repeats